MLNLHVINLVFSKIVVSIVHEFNVIDFNSLIVQFLRTTRSIYRTYQLNLQLLEIKTSTQFAQECNRINLNKSSSLHFHESFCGAFSVHPFNL